MKPATAYIVAPVLFAAVLASATVAAAGPIDPPIGPVESTGRFGPRTEINDTNTPGDADSLFVITQPGSYYLAGNITGVTGKNGIEISANNVTLDLNGFEIVGVGGSLAGISAGSRVANRNGIVRNWGGNGITAGSESLFSGLLLQSNQGHGLFAGTGSTVVKCIAKYNGSIGINVLANSMVDRCISTSNDADGIYAGADSVVARCVAEGNGEDGIDVSDAVLVRDCVCNGNESDGIELSSEAFAVNNVCEGNPVGIRAGNNTNRIEANHVSDNGRGIQLLGTDNLVVKNSATSNSIAGYDMGTGNHYGEIVTDPGAGFTNYSPWANFDFP